MSLIIYLTCYISSFIIYQLALNFIGIHTSIKETLFPSLIVAAIGYVSKICLGASASVQTIVVATNCTALLFLYNKIDILISFVGALLAMITLALGSMLLACPIFVQLGYTIPRTIDFPWLLLALLELVVPVIVLVLLKIRKFSILKYLNNT
jgi:hypothetical protein